MAQDENSKFQGETGEDNLTPLEAALRSHFAQYEPEICGIANDRTIKDHGFVIMPRLAGV